MLIVLFILGIICFYLAKIGIDKNIKVCRIGAAALIFYLVIILIHAIKCCNILASSIIIDDKINLYQEENKNIEDDFNLIILQYMDYESELYKEFKNESSIILVSTIPELKTDELIKQQLELHITNNEKIKELKENRLNIRLAKWWLYFGGM